MKPLRRLGFGLATLFGLAKRGYFIPYRYAATVRPEGYPALEPFFAAAHASMDMVLDAVEAHRQDLAAIGVEPRPAGAPRWDQDWFARLDAAAAYALVRQVRPRQIIEIGSGHSTRFLSRAVADGGHSTTIICIDPAPRAALAGLPVTHLGRVLQPEDAALIASLGADDILFIDSSHVAMPGSDVDRLVLDVLPRLAPGVLVHVHDIFLPDSYPDAWSWRGYNEQTVIGALLLGGGWEIAFASHYALTRLDAAKRLQGIPLPGGALETSLWLRRR